MINLKKFVKYMKTSDKVIRLCAYDGKYYCVGTNHAMAKFETVSTTLSDAIVEVFGKLPETGKSLSRSAHGDISDVAESNDTISLLRVCDPKYYKEAVQYTGLIQASDKGNDYPVDIYINKDRYVFLNAKLTDLLQDKLSGYTDKSKAVLFSGEKSALCIAVSKLLYINNYLKK